MRRGVASGVFVYTKLCCGGAGATLTGRSLGYVGLGITMHTPQMAGVGCSSIESSASGARLL